MRLPQARRLLREAPHDAATGAGGDGRKRAIVTGGSKGVGTVIARTLAEAGLHLAIVGRDEAGLRRTQTEVEAAGSECLICIPLDGGMSVTP
jgi:short-subunit dehydrogenase